MEPRNPVIVFMARSCWVLFAWALSATVVHAVPVVNSAVVKTRIFNDDSDSMITVTDNYPSRIRITDAQLDGDGVGGAFANRHNWRFSSNDMDPAVFNNGDGFSFFTDLVVSGTGNGEVGIQISPWWSQDVDGVLNIRTTDGEIAAFGGRLPFYSFTGTYGISYKKGDTIRLGMDYRPNSLTSADPATVEYSVELGGTLYTSGNLVFDEGNPAEDPPYGLWGMLNDARAGGHVQPFIEPGNPDANLTSEWTEIEFVPEPSSSVPVLLGWFALACSCLPRSPAHRLLV